MTEEVKIPILRDINGAGIFDELIAVIAEKKVIGDHFSERTNLLPIVTLPPKIKTQVNK